MVGKPLLQRKNIMMPSYCFKGSFPKTRLRRLRYTAWGRHLHAETALTPKDLIWPVFVRHPYGEAWVPSMPGVRRFTVEELGKAAQEALALGIQAMALFPHTDASLKNAEGTEAWNPENLVCQAIQAIQEACPQMGLIADVALDPYTDHGHDGLWIEGDVDNDQTLKVLTQQALTLARAGVDAIAPSDMMDGRVGVLREALDQAGFERVMIFSYGAKYASSLYGPFRDAAGSGLSLGKGTKETYQMNPSNRKEAMREIALDVEEGADAIIVKPGTFYLDILYEASQLFPLPFHAYHVSGEYGMLKAAAEKGYINYERTLMENLLAFKRAGASVIWTYGALDAARVLGSA